MSDFHVIIPSFNPGDLISSCIDSIRENIPDARITVVDNNSGDRTVEFLGDHYPGVEVISNQKNLGFGTACNMGAKFSRSPYLIFMNQDAKVEKFPSKDIIDILSKHQVSIVGGRILSTDYSDSPSVGRKVTPVSVLMYWATLPLRTFGFRWFDLIVYWNDKDSSIVQWVTGPLMIFRTADFESLGGFDETFFMYVEDVEICYRAQSKGMRTAHLPSLISIHSDRGGGGVSRMAVHHTLKNQKELLARNYGKFLSSLAISISSLSCILYGFFGVIFPTPFRRFRKSSLNLMYGGADYISNSVWSFKTN